MLLWLAAGSWPTQIDDIYISLSFARSLAETGEFRWPGGSVVEGFSNLLWVLGMAAADMARLDVPWFAQLAALLCGGAVLVFASAWLPEDRRGTLILAGLSLWSPLAWWSSIGMETTFCAALLTLGWPAVASGRSWGLLPLFLAALTRPEAGGILLIGCVVSKRDGWVTGVLGTYAAYHLWRLLTFDNPLSAVAQVKLGGGPFALAQLPVELAHAAPLLWLAWPTGSRSDARWIALAPLATCVVALLAIGGDWMGMARILLPGLSASVVTLARVEGERAEPSWGWLVLLAVVGSVQPRFSVLPAVRVPELAPWRVYAGELEPSLPEDQRWVIENLPDGAVLQSADVGALSVLPGIRVVDSDGLTDRKFAASRNGARFEWVAGWYASDQRPTAIRTAAWSPHWRPVAQPQGLDPWLQDAEASWAEHYAPVATLRHSRDGWNGIIRYDRHDAARPSPERVSERWAELARRFPSQGWYARQGRPPEP